MIRRVRPILAAAAVVAILVAPAAAYAPTPTPAAKHTGKFSGKLAILEKASDIADDIKGEAWDLAAKKLNKTVLLADELIDFKGKMGKTGNLSKFEAHIDAKIDGLVDALNTTTHMKIEGVKDAMCRLGKGKKCGGPAPVPPCTFIPGGAMDTAPAPLACLITSNHSLVNSRMFRDGSNPPQCGATPKAYPGSFGSSQLDMVTMTSNAPPEGTCVNVDISPGTCGTNFFASLWAGTFPLVTVWPSTGTVGDAIFQNDIGSSLTDPSPIEFTVPANTSTFSIVLTTTFGLSSCMYGNITITYT